MGSPANLLLSALLLVPSLVIAAPPERAPRVEPPHGSASAEPMPKLLFEVPEVREYFPSWVDASEALAGGGELNPAVFHPQTIKRLTRLFADSPLRNGCIALTEIYHSTVNPPARTDFESAVRTSELVLLGTVTGRSFGFEGGDTGQLLRVQPDEILKGADEGRKHYYAFIPVGTFTLGDKKICKTDARYPTPPAVGEQVILFVPQGFRNDEEYLEILDDGGILTIRRDETVSVPRRYGNALPNAASSKAGLLESLRAIAGKERER